MSEKDSKEEILKAFKLFDDDDTGRISFANLKRVADEVYSISYKGIRNLDLSCAIPDRCFHSHQIILIINHVQK